MKGPMPPSSQPLWSAAVDRGVHLGPTQVRTGRHRVTPLLGSEVHLVRTGPRRPWRSRRMTDRHTAEQLAGRVAEQYVYERQLKIGPPLQIRYLRGVPDLGRTVGVLGDHDLGDIDLR